MALEIIKILRNETAGTLEILNVEVAANGSYTVPKSQWGNLADDADLQTLVTSGDIVVNDGTSDLTPTLGVNWCTVFGEGSISLFQGGTEVMDRTLELNVTGNLKVTTGPGRRVNLPIDSQHYRVAYDQASLESEIIGLNSIEGGAILLTGEISLTSDLILDLNNIWIHADNSTDNAVKLNGYKLTIKGGGAYFRGVRFLGETNGSGEQSQLLLDIDATDAPEFLWFYGCMFKNLVGSLAPTEDSIDGIVMDLRNVGDNYITIVFDTCEMDSGSISDTVPAYGMPLWFAHGGGTKEIAVSNQQKQIEGRNRYVIPSLSGTPSASTFLSFQTDGTALLAEPHPDPAYFKYEPASNQFASSTVIDIADGDVLTFQKNRGSISEVFIDEGLARVDATLGSMSYTLPDTNVHCNGATLRFSKNGSNPATLIPNPANGDTIHNLATLTVPATTNSFKLTFDQDNANWIYSDYERISEVKEGGVIKSREVRSLNFYGDVNVVEDTDGEVTVSVGLDDSEFRYMYQYSNVDVYLPVGTTAYTAAFNLEGDRSTTVPYTYDVGNYDFTCQYADKYLLIGKITTAQYTGSTRSEYRSWVEVDTGGGWVEYPGSEQYHYSRQSTQGRASHSSAILLDASVGDKFRLRAQYVSGSSTNGYIDASATSVFISTVYGKGSKGDRGADGTPGNGLFRGEWSSLSTYILNDLIRYEGSLYVSLQDGNLDNTPPDITTGADSWWSLVVEKGDTPPVLFEVQQDYVSVSTAVDNLNFTDMDINNDGGGRVSITNVFGSEQQDAEKLTEQSTTSTTFVNYLTLAVGELPVGRYRCGWFYEWRYSGGSNDFGAQVQWNDSETFNAHEEEPQDKSTDIRYNNSGFAYVNVTNSNISNFIDLDFSSDGSTAYMYKGRLEIWRVS